MRRVKQFRTWSMITIIATIVLIGVGGLVRSTGAGMGCPDWPKCFDCWVPPTNALDLPADYRAHYVALREKKNIRVAKTLSRLGMGDIAQKIINDPSVHDEESFNAVKTWIEYLNRLVGVLVGFFIFITTVLAWRVRQLDFGFLARESKIENRKLGNRIFYLSLLGFIGVGFEGWLGSIVVSTNLMPGFITVHMIVALLILIALITSYQLSDVIYQQNSFKPSTLSNQLQNRSDSKLKAQSLKLKITAIIVCVLVIAQILMGTQVRQQVDIIAKTMGENQRDNWITHLTGIYNIHKYFYYLLTVAIVYWYYQLRNYFDIISGVRFLSFGLLALLLAEVIFGISMNNYGIQKELQPLHLLFGVLIFSSVYALTIKIFNYKL